MQAQASRLHLCVSTSARRYNQPVVDVVFGRFPDSLLICVCSVVYSADAWNVHLYVSAQAWVCKTLSLLHPCCGAHAALSHAPLNKGSITFQRLEIQPGLEKAVSLILSKGSDLEACLYSQHAETCMSTSCYQCGECYIWEGGSCTWIPQPADDILHSSFHRSTRLWCSQLGHRLGLVHLAPCKQGIAAQLHICNILGYQFNLARQVVWSRVWPLAMMMHLQVHSAACVGYSPSEEPNHLYMMYMFPCQALYSTTNSDTAELW